MQKSLRQIFFTSMLIYINTISHDNPCLLALAPKTYELVRLNLLKYSFIAKPLVVPNIDDDEDSSSSALRSGTIEQRCR